MLNKILLLLFLVTAISSCSKDDSLDNLDLDVQGVWKLTELNIDRPVDINGDLEAHTNILDETRIIDATLTFDDETSGTVFYRSWIGFNTSENNGKLDFLVMSTLSSDHSPESFNYASENGKIIVNTDISYNKKYSGISELEVQGDRLKITILNGFVVTDEITLEETVNEDLTYVFEKQ